MPTEISLIVNKNPAYNSSKLSYFSFFSILCSYGSCRYLLNLTSSARVTSGNGLGYKKSIRKGFISLVSIDLSRFTLADEVNCLPVCLAPSKTKLFSHKCGVFIGNVVEIHMLDLYLTRQNLLAHLRVL